MYSSSYEETREETEQGDEFVETDNFNGKTNQAIDLWRDIPYYLKDLNTFSFAREIKHYLLSEQYSKKFE